MDELGEGKGDLLNNAPTCYLNIISSLLSTPIHLSVWSCKIILLNHTLPKPKFILNPTPTCILN